MKFNMQSWSPVRVGVLVAVAGGLLCSATWSTPVEAAPKKSIVGREPWPGKRVVLVLPLTLGEGWNADRNAGALLLPQAQDRFHEALQATGKFSIIEAHRFNPILNRALQDKVITREQLDELINNPSVESGRQVLAGMTFTQQPMIADFRLEEVRTTGAAPAANNRTVNQPSIQVQVAGRLYEATNPVAVNSVVVTSNPIVRSRTETTLDAAVLAAADSFRQIVAQFVAPLPDIEFAPLPSNSGTTPPGTPAPNGMPTAPPALVPIPPPATSTLPGGGFAGASSAGSPFPMPVLPAPTAP